MKDSRHLEFPIVLLLATACAAIVLAGQTTSPSPQESDSNVRALIVGISNYAHVEPLQFAALDAQAFREFLISPRGGSVPADNVHTLIEDQATRFAVMHELDWFKGKIKGTETVYVYLAGHGIVDEDEVGSFIPSDGNLDEQSATCVSFSQLKELIEKRLARAARRILITDMCHAGQIGPEQNFVNEALRKMSSGNPSTFLNLLASRPSESSMESEKLGRGIFTHALMEALNGKAVAQGETIVTSQKTVDYVKKTVQDLTQNQQHPVANDNFDPTMALAFLDKPGPAPRVAGGGAVLEIINVDKSTFARVQWTDPKTTSVAVRQLPRDRKLVQIGSLVPGTLELRFFDAENRSQSRTVSLTIGRNTLDLGSKQVGLNQPGESQAAIPEPGKTSWMARKFSIASAGLLKTWQTLSDARWNYTYSALAQANSLRTSPTVATLTAALPAAALQNPAVPGPASTEEATVLLKVETGTGVYVDGSYFGNSEGRDRFLQVQGLTPGAHNLTLVESPEHEQRFRVKLFSGPQIFDVPSGELRAVAAVQQPPSQLQVPADLPANLAQTYRRFYLALWEERLIDSSGDSAWDHYQRLQAGVSPRLQEILRKELVVAMGNKAQRIILKYLRGGDMRWNAQIFDEGATLISRVQQLLNPTPSLQSEESFFRGRSMIERGQYAQAVSELQRAVQLDPGASYAHNALGLALWKQNLIDRALVPLQRSITLSPRWSYPRNNLALIYIEQRRYADAEKAFTDAIQVNREDSTAYHGLGQVYFLLDRWQDAETQIRRAIDLHPGNAYAYHTLGLLYQRLQRRPQAEEMLRLAIRLEPEEPAFQISLGRLLQEVGRVQDARSVLSALVTRHPDNIEGLHAYAAFLASQNQIQQADQVFKQAFKISGNDSMLRVGYGTFLKQQGKVDEAAREFKSAIRISPENAFAHYGLADIYLSQKKLQETESELALAIKADPRYASPPFLLGRIRYAQKNYSQALSLYDQALKLSIDPSQRQELREAIQEAQTALARTGIEEAEKKKNSRDYRAAWALYAGALKTSPESHELRDRILEFRWQHPGESDLSSLPAGMLKEVLSSEFWKNLERAEELWRSNRHAEASRQFASALARLDPDTRRKVAGTSFNSRNENYGMHQLVHTWAMRRIEERDYPGALELMESAVRQNIFGVVPPLSVDSLMIPPDNPDPKRIEEFDIEHHPERRAHEVYAAAYAGLGDVSKAREYLAPLESAYRDVTTRRTVAEVLRRERKFDEASLLLKQALENPRADTPEETLAAAYVLAADTLCEAGRCAEGRQTLEAGRARLPNNKTLREALEKPR